MLSGDARVYLATHFRSARDELLRKRDVDLANVAGGVTDFQSGISGVRYQTMFQPHCHFMVGLARAHADATLKAYEFDGSPLTHAIVDSEVMPEVKKILNDYSRRVISSERLWTQLTTRGTPDSSIFAKLASLANHFNKIVVETQESIRNDLTLRMLEAKRNTDKRKRGAVPAGKHGRWRHRVKSLRSDEATGPS
jgi:hypothetical protein